MSAPSSRLALVFSCVGHFYIHLFTAFYFVIVLTLEAEWSIPYHELIGLWTLGSLLVGLAALPAGRLGDVWSVSGMMVVFFMGLGGAAILCGLVSGPAALMVGLTGIGLFAAIYHPIGIPWLIRNAEGNTGRLLAINGIFGSLGAAGAGLIAGLLIDLFGWRVAFIAPGLVSVATGLAMVAYLRAGRIADATAGERETPSGGQGGTVRAFAILILAMFMGGLVYHGTQAALPKLFAIRLQDFVGDGATRVGVLVATVYVAGGFMQLIGGYLADRYPLKLVYLLAWTVETVFLVALAVAAGFGAVGAALLAVLANTSQLPAENMMLARYTPQRHYGLAFGAKFVLAFGAAPLALQIVAYVQAATGEFRWFFFGLGAAAVMISLLVLLLPPSPEESAAPAIAE